MTENTQLYAKDNNLIQLGLFYFGKMRPVPTETVTKWSDETGSYELSCNCNLGVPGSMEQDTYAACMRLWIKQSRPPKSILITYSDIARELGLDPKAWCGKIKKSLEKLGQARYRFIQCFIKADANGNKKVDAHFSLFDTALLFSRNKETKWNDKSEIFFPDIIMDNLEAKYYQFLDMQWYRALSGGLPRRLYEYLAKRRYHCSDGTFVISEELICRWLPIQDCHTANRRKRLTSIANKLIKTGFLAEYKFDKVKKQCSFTFSKGAIPPQYDILEKEIIVNDTEKEVQKKLPKKLPKDLPAQEVLDEQLAFYETLSWIKKIPYFHEKKVREIATLPISVVVNLYPQVKKKYDEKVQSGNEPKAFWVYSQFIGKNKKFATKLKQPTERQINFLEDKIEEKSKIAIGTIKDLVDLIKAKRLTKKLRSTVEIYLHNRGYKYVENNIFYANEKAKKNYSSYLQQALKENWAEEWSEEQVEKRKAQQEYQKRQQEEEFCKAKEVEEIAKKFSIIESQREQFKKRVVDTPKRVKELLMKEADSSVDSKAIGRSMNVKIEYRKLLLKMFNEEGDDFDEAVIGELGFINEIATL